MAIRSLLAFLDMIDPRQKMPVPGDDILLEAFLGVASSSAAPVRITKFSEGITSALLVLGALQSSAPD
jgi:hypothetical protein